MFAEITAVRDKMCPQVSVVSDITPVTNKSSVYFVCCVTHITKKKKKYP